MNYPWGNKGFFDGFKKLSGFAYEAVAYFPNGLQLEKYIDIDNVRVKTKNFAEEKKESGSFFVQQGNDYRKIAIELEREVASLSKEDFSHYDNEQLAEVLINLHQKIEPYFAYSNWYYLLSIEIESLLRERWKGSSSADIQETLLALAVPYLPNGTARFSLALNEAALEYKESSENEKDKILNKASKKLASEFFWMTSFSGSQRTPESFMLDIKTASLTNNRAETSHQARLNVPQGWVAAMKVATYVKDDISTYFVPYYWLSLSKLWETIRQRIGLENREDLWYFSYVDIADYLNSNRLVSEEEIRERKSGIVTEEGQTGVKVRIGKDAQSFLNSSLKREEHRGTEEIRGSAAYPGLVRGKVRVIKERSQFSSFNEGEILIAPYTAPEYVSLMRKAIAIVTDTGGITSHAAIVSRELRIPCVVGTKVASRVLKDGDTVEVDAESGIVKKLN
jgi:phosphohistidine swiveling domain-containing protein